MAANGDKQARKQDEKAKNLFHDATKDVKDVLDVVEKLRARRKELKLLLNKETVVDRDDEELRLAVELATVSRTIRALDESRCSLYEKLVKAAPGGQ
jgi:hypothetical protein